MKRMNCLVNATLIILMAFGGEQLSIAQSSSTSPDYKMLNLKGKVKSYTIEGEVGYWDIIGRFVEFDRNGKIITVEGNKAKLFRNAKGQIVKYTYEYYSEDDGEWITRTSDYTYDQYGRIANIRLTTPFDSWNNRFERDWNGDIKNWVVKSSIDPEFKKKYEYQAYDKYGNWTRRTIDGVTSVRRITYYSDDSSVPSIPSTNNSEHQVAWGTQYDWLSTRNATYDDIRNYDKGQIRVLRNSIYARHGRKFNDSKLRSYFNAQEWYVPRYDEVPQHYFNKYENYNINFLKQYE